MRHNAHTDLVRNKILFDFILCDFLADYDTTDDEDDPEEFQIVVLLATGETQLKVDWSTLIESDVMHYGMKS
jgi:hypothetical protein